MNPLQFYNHTNKTKNTNKSGESYPGSDLDCMVRQISKCLETISKMGLFSPESKSYGISAETSALKLAILSYFSKDDATATNDETVVPSAATSYKNPKEEKGSDAFNDTNQSSIKMG